MTHMKILHAVGSLNRGGIETWLTNIVRLGRPEMRMDFILGAGPGESGDYEKVVQDFGSRIFYRKQVSRIAKRMRVMGLCPQDDTLRTLLKSGNYDVFHVHGDEFTGDAVREARLAGTPVRVAHCHHTMLTRGKVGAEMVVRRARFRLVDRPRIMRYATDLLACGRDAGRLIAGEAWQSDPRCKVVYCGVPLADFSRSWQKADRSALLNRYSLPSDAIVVGHAGSMGPVPVKNHEFLIRAFDELSRRNRRYHLVMAGDGPLRQSLESLVRQLGLSTRVTFAGLISDVPAHMAHLFDVHVLPSLAEGLPVVAIEAAAAGLYTVMSENVTEEVVDHLPGRIERVSLSAPLAHWADRIESGVGLREPPAAGLARVNSTPLSIEKSAQDLIDVYSGRLAARALSPA